MQPWVQGASVIAIDDLAGVEETAQHSTTQQSDILSLSFVSDPLLAHLGQEDPFLILKERSRV
jgi:hypothetical protein